MNKKYLLSAFIISLSVLFSYSLLANALSRDDIVFPIAELNNCADESECRAYCDSPDHITACVSFAEKYGLMSSEEAAMARKFASLGGTGPGGCDSKESCEIYCGDVANIEVCVSFAEENDLIPHKEVQEAKKIAKILREGKKLPGNCRGKIQCENYCQNPDHMEECLAFGEETGLMAPEELEKAKKFIPLMKRGETPGGCRTKEQCESYCTEGEEHIDECADFALKVGAATKEEMEMFKKTKGRGPGGCKGRLECEAFCNDPVNQEACFKFAEEHGFMKKGDVEQMKGHMNQFKEELNRFPPEVLECLKSRAGNEIIEKIRNGTLTPGPEIGRHIQACFEAFKPQMEQMMHQGMPQGMPPGGGFGPGSAEECSKHGGNWNGQMCDFGSSECVRQGGSWDGTTCNFPEGQSPGIQCEFPPCGPPEGGQASPPNVFTGPGGCKTPAECQAYCMANPTICQGFKPSGDGPVYQTQPQVSPPIQNVDQSSEECMKQGGIWNGARCDFSVRECANQGGVWDGSSCNFPPPPTGDGQQQFPYQHQKNKYTAAILQFLIHVFGSGK
ncbi:MAG: hypothetical protein Q8R55_06520 [Candidatus Taylorbacteria bacterium]|nr:hypothetical protein [Candidatus Taylorbacteria bacterium]